MAMTTLWRMPPENSCGYYTYIYFGVVDAHIAHDGEHGLLQRRAAQALVQADGLADLRADGL